MTAPRRAATIAAAVLVAIVGGGLVLANLWGSSSSGPGAGACGPVSEPPDTPYVAIAGLPCTRTASVTGQIRGHVAPGGAEDGSTIGAFSGGEVDLVILGNDVVAAGVPWLRVYVRPQSSGGGDADLFTWLPVSADGQVRIHDIADVACPPTRDNPSTLGTLDPISRARCIGSAPVTITGITGHVSGGVSYEVEPLWLGTRGSRGGFSIRKDPFGEPIDVQLPDGVATPPVGFVIEVTMHAGDQAARSCTRSVDAEYNPPLVPVEAPADSALWCAARLVAESWTARLGPEHRPIDPANPQLHRTDGYSACGGVGSGPLRFRMDATALDPVWLEREDGSKAIPYFTAKFDPAFQPDLVIVDEAGLVLARDGQVIDPNQGRMPGASLCATGRGVLFQ